MCTSVIFFKKNEDWPIIIGSNRDESLNRQSLFPGRHWEKYPHIVAGKDLKRSGTWIGINDYGIFGLIHNRNFKNNNENNKTSRGLLLLDILKKNSIEKILTFISNIDKKFYNDFNLLFGNFNSCYFIQNDIQNKRIIIEELNEGLSIITDKNINDLEDEKINIYYNIFNKSQLPNPFENNWKEWIKILTTIDKKKIENTKNICFLNKKLNYGTKSSSLIAIPNNNIINERIIFKASNYFPTTENYINVSI